MILRDRKDLDNLVFDMLGLTRGEREAVYEAVIDMVESRLNKAGSLKDNKKENKRLAAVEGTVGIWSDIPRDTEEEE